MMEKEHKRGLFAVKRRIPVAGTALAGVLFVAQGGFLVSENNQDQSHLIDGHQFATFTPIPNDQFRSFAIPVEQDSFQSHSVGISSSDEMLEPERKQTKKELITQELEGKREYWYKLAQASEKFNKNQLGDMWIYLPYYIAAGEKFDVDWLVLYLNHQRESGGSAKNSKAFDGSTYPNVGGMQLDINYWTPKYQKSAVEDGKNLSFLENIFPTRHKGDMESIFAAAKMIGANEDKNFNRTHSESDSIRFGFVRFTGSLKSGEARYQEYRRIKQIFMNQIDEVIYSQR